MGTTTTGGSEDREEKKYLPTQNNSDKIIQLQKKVK